MHHCIKYLNIEFLIKSDRPDNVKQMSDTGPVLYKAAARQTAAKLA